MITLIQYAGQNVSPENDASVYNALARGANSCLTEIEANITEQGKIAFTDGYMLIQGRVVHLESHTITPVLPESGTATGTIYIEIDITNTDAPCQIKTTLDAFVPVQGDINLGGSLYQLQIGTYSATTVQAVAGSINMTLPASADTTFKLGYKNDSTGRAIIDADSSGAYMRLYSQNNIVDNKVIVEATSLGGYAEIKGTNNQNRVYINTANQGEINVDGINCHIGLTSKDESTIFIKNGDDISAIGKTSTFTGSATFQNGIETGKIEQANGIEMQGGGVINGYANGTTFLAGEAIDGKISIGQMVARIAYDGDGGRMIIYNRNGDERIRFGITGSGAGKIEILDADGNTHKVLTE